MKFNKKIKRLFCGVLTVLFVAGGASDSYAASKTYKFSNLDIQIEVPSELTVFTRNVTSHDPGLELINTSAEELRVRFEQYNVYLEAFPDDAAYEIVVSGKTVSEDVKDFNTLDDTQINIGLEAYRAKCESVTTDTITSAVLYKNSATSYYQIDFISKSNDVTVYVRKYYTVMQGKEISFTLQSKNAELNKTMSDQLLSIVDSAIFKNIKASITESPFFTEIGGFLLGVAIIGGIIGAFIFVMNKSTKKPKKL